MVTGSIPPAHILLFCQRSGKSTEHLVQFLIREGLDVQVVDVFSICSSQLDRADLILLEALERVDAVTETVVSRIRLESRVPLVMLTDSHSTEQLVSALSAGVDAIWSLQSPPEVLLARCRALLRRWLPG
jgi:DNA-binding response OmpR family regulator